MKQISSYKITFIALSAGINLIGGIIALTLRLPVYLDSLGTMMAAALLGPVYGMIPGAISALINGCTFDAYAFYYLPVQLITGAMTGFACKLFQPEHIQKSWKLIPVSLLISLPGTAVSSLITAAVFGGITSSGSTILVQLLHHAGFNLTASVFLVQVCTDYMDRLLSLGAVMLLAASIPPAMKFGIQKGDIHGAL